MHVTHESIQALVVLLAGRTTARRSEIGQYGVQHRDTGQHQEHRSYAAERPDQHAGQERAGGRPTDRDRSGGGVDPTLQPVGHDLLAQREQV